MSDLYDRLRNEARFRIICLLEPNPGISQNQLAAVFQLITDCTNILLETLAESYFIKLVCSAATEDEWRNSYSVMANGWAEKVTVTCASLVREIAEYQMPRQEIAALEIEFTQEQSEKEGCRQWRAL